MRAQAEDEAEKPEARLARPRMRLGFGAAIVLALVALSATVGIGLLQGRASTVTEFPAGDGGASETGIAAPEVYVHVLGEVAAPGLYVLDDGARVADALAVAGGTLPGADLRAVNLARLVTDGEQIIVPAVGADPGATAGGTTAGDGLIDINTADASTLEELPRIGPALAARIIEWRESNGRFTSVDDLLGVSGIGEKLLSGLRDKVRV